MVSKRFYITTPLYYVNGSPHIGHSYTNIAADVLARYRKMCGDDVYFLTGTDEHGQKIEKAAAATGHSDVKKFCDFVVDQFVQLWKMLNISHDDFIRTTDSRHKEAVKNILSILYDKGEIYESNYEGWYCTPCETFWIESQLEEKLCPDCQRPVEHISEKNYFLKVSKYRDWLRDYIKKNPGFILPRTRFNEISSFLETPLNDLCISRPSARVSWGIPIPFDQNYVTYVWFEALLNYITAPGFSEDKDKFNTIWPADVHFMAKDILRYHAVYWPIMLHMLGLELPKIVFSHGWWLLEKSEGSLDKMSKSKGNVIDPRVIAEQYSVDALRYFLLREVSFGSDGCFSEPAFIKRINSDLANDFGNLIYRTLNMLIKYYQGNIPSSERARENCDEVFKKNVQELDEKVARAFGVLDYQTVLIEIWELIKSANKYIENKAPWKLQNENKEELDFVMYNLSEVLRIILLALAPFIPDSAQKAWRLLGYKDQIQSHSYKEVSHWGGVSFNQKVDKGEPLFPRIE
ncbi:MAG: methionine--tRNA ligase [Candidatus Saelkia tenebricola]|nr:methionine--tRNA ligase [Candidatus Saelkia tenebricola]